MRLRKIWICEGYRFATATLIARIPRSKELGQFQLAGLITFGWWVSFLMERILLYGKNSAVMIQSHDSRCGNTGLSGRGKDRQSRIRPSPAAACSSVMEKLLFTKVIPLILIHSEALKVTQRHEMPTVVKPPCFYYFLTTNDCRDLPPNASFCHFGLFSVTE